MKKIKCEYCGRKYSPLNQRDCCPDCGAFNEFKEEENKVTHHKIININFSTNSNKIKNSKKKKLPKIISIPLITFITLFIFIFGLAFISVIIESSQISNYEKIALNYSDELLTDNSIYMNVIGDNFNIDWDKEYVITGNFTDIIKCLDYLSERQVSYIVTDVSINEGKIVYLDNTIYLDKMEINWYDSNSAYIHFEVESKGESSKKPSEVEIYLVNGTEKVRIKEDDYGITYKDEIFSFKDLFTNYYSGSINLESSMSTLKEFEKLQVIIDDEVFEFTLNFNDTKSNLYYYGLK